MILRFWGFFTFEEQDTSQFETDCVKQASDTLSSTVVMLLEVLKAGRRKVVFVLVLCWQTYGTCMCDCDAFPCYESLPVMVFLRAGLVISISLIPVW